MLTNFLQMKSAACISAQPFHEHAFLCAEVNYISSNSSVLGLEMSEK